MSVDRYSPRVSSCDNSRSFKSCDLESEHTLDMDSDIVGQYVLFDDYETLEDDKDNLQTELDDANDAIKELVDFLYKLLSESEGSLNGVCMIEECLISEAESLKNKY